ncbi:hypothetical protein GF322_03045 [Candidatus Dependentiae bacterium]|nr:hypothetical protein [Candidatus Dependentiae bacterium]
MNKFCLVSYSFFFSTINILFAQGGPMDVSNGRGFGRGYFYKCWRYAQGGMGRFMWFVILLLVIIVVILGIMLYKNNKK